ncbi:MAG: thioredoxin domain-containing protein [Patescibacteria group bacterium]
MNQGLKNILWIIAVVAFILFIFIVVNVLFQEKPHIVFEEEDGIDIPLVVSSDPQIGNKDAQVVIVNYGDFQSDGSAEVARSLSRLHEEFPDDLLVIWKDFPNTSLHPEAYQAALAARCAQDQDAFWQYHDLLFDTADFSNENLLTIAEGLELKMNKFENCLKKQTFSETVATSFNEGISLRIMGTPTLYINNRRYTGEMTEFYLQQLILDIIEP